MLAAGIDIGGTKCAVCLGEVSGTEYRILHRCPPRKTKDYTPAEMLDALCGDLLSLKQFPDAGNMVERIGISCGGPLDSKAGLILTPPNLPGWNHVAVTDYFEKQTGWKAALCNDANACALAEWRFGAGKGCSDMLFLTFGTGLGAGLILNSRLYTGASDMAGELGHIRLSDYGPVGYGKMGSFEGFCSGGGIAQFAKAVVMQELQAGRTPELCPSLADLESLTAEKVGLAAKTGDALAKEILKQTGAQLGKGLSILIDLLNPQRIVIGSIFARCYEELWPAAEEIILRETLKPARAVCEVVPSQLSESVGDVAALTVAWYDREISGSLFQRVL